MTAQILRGLECSTIFLSQKYYDMLCECHFRITDVVIGIVRKMLRKYRGNTEAELRKIPRETHGFPMPKDWYITASTVEEGDPILDDEPI